MPYVIAIKTVDNRWKAYQTRAGKKITKTYDTGEDAVLDFKESEWAVDRWLNEYPGLQVFKVKYPRSTIRMGDVLETYDNESIRKELGDWLKAIQEKKQGEKKEVATALAEHVKDVEKRFDIYIEKNVVTLKYLDDRAKEGESIEEFLKSSFCKINNSIYIDHGAEFTQGFIIESDKTHVLEVLKDLKEQNVKTDFIWHFSKHKNNKEDDSKNLGILTGLYVKKELQEDE